MDRSCEHSLHCPEMKRVSRDKTFCLFRKFLTFPSSTASSLFRWYLMAHSFFTVGHSTRSIAEFVNLLEASQIEVIVDVRRIPQSRTNPQFNRDTLRDALASVQIGYVHVVARWFTKSVCEGIAQPAMGEPAFSELCRLRDDPRIPQRSD
jgi:hypothetical protein